MEGTKSNGPRKKKKKSEAIEAKPYSAKERPHLKFVVNFHSRENGERKRMRKFFETRTEADEFAKQKNTERENTGIEGAEFSTELRVTAQKAIEKLKRFTGATIEAAVDHYVQYLEASAKSCTAHELVDELVAAKKADNASKRYLEDLRSRLNRFAKKFDGQMVATISGAQIDDWLRGLKLSATSRNNFRRVLIVAFNYAKQRGYCLTNPAETSAKAKALDGAVEILTVQETARLLEAASSELLPHVAIGAFAGLRRAELERLDWSEVHFDDNLIEELGTKRLPNQP